MRAHALGVAERLPAETGTSGPCSVAAVVVVGIGPREHFVRVVVVHGSQFVQRVVYLVSDRSEAAELNPR